MFGSGQACVGVRVLTTPTEEKQPFLAGLLQVKNCFQNPEMVAKLSSVSSGALGGTGLSWEGGRQASKSAGTPDPPYCIAHLPRTGRLSLTAGTYLETIL